MFVVNNLLVPLIELVVGADGAAGFATEILPVSGLPVIPAPAHTWVGLAAIPCLSGIHTHSK